ncbi:helix-turn-helix domain-containing protein [Bradyrhizobium cajani]|uniref:Helix-turn-helix domain-containing protein n=1 Tax=Bradyrhizobium cajani TaxID=1928661 RepID=A0A844SY54_9BRAD|nr:AraC family transcriptional regulator [Bradyrhizobium cajani]MCP3368044.1 AraC family transcriptional regulator [Bradyrhizobium cajani]MVT71873.1 helix-turn-helix domain-containing protein [Bradyrhizobium cajani]
MTLEPSPTDQAAGKTSSSPDTVQALRHASGRGHLAEWQLRRLSEAIESSATPWSIEAMATLIGLSPGRFCKRFRTTTGVPPHRWQMLQRLERAKQLLRDPSLTLTDIAYACGYASSAHFSTSFRRATGTTPSKYRRRCTAHAR